MSKPSKEGEIDEIRNLFMQGGFSDLPILDQEEEEEPKEESTEVPEDNPEPNDPEPEPKDKPDEEPEEDPLPFKVTPLDDSKVAELAAKTAAETVRQMQPAPPEPNIEPEPKPEPWEDTLRAMGKKGQYLAKLQSLKPEKYGDLGKRIHDFKAKEKEYRQTWEEENEGLEFDRNDPEHKDFFRKNEPSVYPDDYEEAREVFIEEQAAARVEAKFRPVVEEQRRKQMEQEVAPKIRDAVAEIVLEAVASIDDDAKAIVEQDKTLNSLEEKDPIAAKALNEVSESYVPVIAVAAKIVNGVPVDQNDTASQAFMTVWANMENQAVQTGMPDVRDPKTGAVKKFTTIQQFISMPKAQQSRHYTITPADILARLKDDYRGQVKAKTGQYRDLVSKVAGSTKPKSGQTAGSQATPAKQTDAQTPQPQRVAKSPSVGSRSPSVTPSGSGKGSSKEPGEVLKQWWL
jgi:hypothetical protein